MYEKYTRQSLPTKEYRDLLGAALYVFNCNNSFIIENLIRTDNAYDWYSLTDQVSGRLIKEMAKTISKRSGHHKIASLFEELVEKRNRIIHSFGITSKDGQQVLATKTKKEYGNKQFVITEDYLRDFINKNEKLCDMLYRYRDTF